MRVYFDNAASTPIRDEVGQFLKSGNAGEFYNPSSVHQEGQLSRAQISKARDLISEILECQTENILFTSSGTRRVTILLVMPPPIK